MRKFKICVLGLCLLAILSCNNADKEFLNVGKDGETSIECSNLDQIVEIPIESSGSWVALLPEVGKVLLVKANIKGEAVKGSYASF